MSSTVVAVVSAGVVVGVEASKVGVVTEESKLNEDVGVESETVGDGDAGVVVTGALLPFTVRKAAGLAVPSAPFQCASLPFE